MAILDASELHQKLLTMPDVQRVATAYALRTFAFHARYPSDYAANPRWAEIVVPSDAGHELLKRVSTQAIRQADLKLALFGLFSFQDLLLDVDRTDIAQARSLLEDEAKAGHIRWPSIHGRVLYDRYQELFNERHDNLHAADVARLLDGSPQGVFQVNSIVSGPMGLLESQCVRSFPPRAVLGLWHCPKVNCRALHHVALQPPTIPLVEAYRLLTVTALNLWTTASRWYSALSVWPNAHEDRWRATTDMPLFLGDCIVGNDRKRLLVRALSSPHGATLRAAIQRSRPKGLPSEPQAFANALSADEQLQLLLLVSDAEIKLFLDELVLSQAIIVPSTEVRAVDDSKSITPFSATLQLSSLGVRALGKHPVQLLRSSIWRAYAESNELPNLDWRLRKEPEHSTEDALMDYMRRRSPTTTIESLLLASPAITRSFASSLDTRVDRPTERTATLLAWKLGFDLPRDDRGQATILRLLDLFGDAARSIGRPQTDQDREAIRGPGASLFVELERYLQEFVAYLAWILHADHPKRTRFVYSQSDALSTVPVVLGSQLSSGTEVLKWSPWGNALGVCVRYCQRVAEWMSSLSREERTRHRRPVGDAHVRSTNAVTRFAFEHEHLWADAAPDALAQLAQCVTECVEKLNRAEVAYVRNGLDHYRESDKFPSIERILSCVESLRAFVVQCQADRLVPKLYWIGGYHEDAYGQGAFDLSDFKGATLRIFSPRTVSGLLQMRALPQSRPILVAPGNLLGLPNADILFSIREESEYARFWQGYPAVVPPQLPQADEDYTTSSTPSGGEPSADILHAREELSPA